MTQEEQFLVEAHTAIQAVKKTRYYYDGKSQKYPKGMPISKPDEGITKSENITEEII